jgi:hypothetical protein
VRGQYGTRAAQMGSSFSGGEEDFRLVESGKGVWHADAQILHWRAYKARGHEGNALAPEIRVDASKKNFPR